MLTRMILGIVMVFSLASAVAAQTDTDDTPNAYEPQPIEIDAGGVEVFPEPDRASGRLFAITGDFMPFLVGQSDDGAFYYIYYFERETLQDGWVPIRQLKVDEWDYAERVRVPFYLPDAVPPLPDDLPYSEAAERIPGYQPTP